MSVVHLSCHPAKLACPVVCCPWFLSTGVAGRLPYLPDFCVGAGYSNSGPQAYTTGTLPTKPSTQPAIPTLHNLSENQHPMMTFFSAHPILLNIDREVQVCLFFLKYITTVDFSDIKSWFKNRVDYVAKM